MVDLPAEIWFRILKFLPNDSLRSRDMMRINRIFFDMGMDARYKVTSLTARGSQGMKIIKRLADPSVACRVRTLSLQLDISSIFPQIFPQRSLLAGSNPADSSTVARSPHPGVISPQEFSEALADVFPGMCNIEEFIFISSKIPSDLDLQPFSLIAWRILNKTLRKLSFTGSLEGCGKMLVSLPSLDCLQELSLEFMDEVEGSNSVADTATLLDSVAPLIVQASTQLISLKLDFSTSTDLSSFFKQLCPLTALRRLDICAAFNRSLDDDPSGLAKLLSGSSSTLRYLRLRFEPNFSRANDAVHMSSKPPLTEWLLRTIANDSTISTSLETLELDFRRNFRFEVLLNFVRRSVSTLRKLVLRKCYFQFQEVEAIIQLFRSQADPPLASLDLSIISLNADLFDLLGNSLPELHYLKLNIGYIAGDDLLAMENQSFPNCKLYALNICVAGTRLNGVIKEFITKCFPSIQHFRDEGDV